MQQREMTQPKAETKMMMVSKNTLRSYHLLDTYNEWEQTLQPFDLIAFGPRPAEPSSSSCCCCQLVVTPGEAVSKCLITCESVHTCQQAHWSHVGVAVPGQMIDFAPDKTV